MSPERVDHLDLLRIARRSAGDQRKVLLTVYGLLLFVPVGLLVLAFGRSFLFDGFLAEMGTTFLRPAVATAGFFRAAFEAGAWGLLAGVLLGIWLAAMLVGSFFGLAVTRMAAIELTCDRRGDVGEALRFARRHWHWAFLTPACLILAAVILLGAAAARLALGRVSELLLVVAAPCALVLALGAVVIVFGLLAGGGLAWSTIATEWSDAFDAITRVYGYSFAHSYRVLLYRIGAFIAWCGAVLSRGFRALLVLGGFYLALVVGLGRAHVDALFDAALLEPPGGPPLPQTVAGWTIVACIAIFLTMQVARLLVFRLVLRQGIYLLLRLRVDRVPLDNIDGYRPDDSAFDPTAQGFELVEVEEELPAE
jgi:hypothetical protein